MPRENLGDFIATGKGMFLIFGGGCQYRELNCHHQVGDIACSNRIFPNLPECITENSQPEG